MVTTIQLLNFFWIEVVNTTTYLTNCNPSKPNGELILEHVYVRKPPQLRHMKMFGCLAYIHISKMKGDKLVPQMLCGIFVGYDDVWHT